jgi:hypothetical protein
MVPVSLNCYESVTAAIDPPEDPPVAARYAGTSSVNSLGSWDIMSRNSPR